MIQLSLQPSSQLIHTIDESVRTYNRTFFYMKEKGLPFELARRIAYESAIQDLLI